VRDGVALLAILARVRRRLRAMAAIEGAVRAGALALGAVAIGLALARWRLGAFPAHLLRWDLAVAGAAGAGAIAGAVRRIPLERCARIVDRTPVGVGHDRLLSALSFWQRRDDAADGDRTGDRTGLTPFMVAAIADAVGRGSAYAPGVIAPFRRPRALPALAAAALLLGAAALVPLPARGSRAPLSASPPAGNDPPAARVHLRGDALDPEREQIAAALRAAAALGDPELAALARGLAATVNDLAGQGLERGAALDRLAELQRRSEEASADLASLRQGIAQASQALQTAPATREAGRALAAGDAAGTEKAINELAAQAAAASDAERNRIAGTLDQAGDRVRGPAPAATPDGRPPGAPASATTGGDPPPEASASLTPDGEPRAGDDDGEPGEERPRRLARDDQRPPRSSSSPPTHAAPRGPRPRRLQRLERELRETAAACRTDPESCRRKLQRQAHELPRMEDEVRSLDQRQRLAEAVRQLRDRLRRESNGGNERAREERRFLRAARGESPRDHERHRQQDPDPDDQARVAVDDPEGLSDEGDDRDDEEGGGDPSSGDSAMQTSGAEEGSGQAAGDQAGAGQAANSGDGIGNQKGDAPLGERGALTTRGHAREAQVRDGAGPTRAQVIQSAARRGFAHAPYQRIYGDYQAAVEESLDASAVPPGRRYIVRRYFQLIRPQSSSRSPR
jgi:hypothetical protein